MFLCQIVRSVCPCTDLNVFVQTNRFVCAKTIRSAPTPTPSPPTHTLPPPVHPPTPSHTHTHTQTHIYTHIHTHTHMHTHIHTHTHPHNKYTQQVLVYNFGDLKLLHQIETLSNPRGLVAISSTAESTVLATPGLHTGQVGSRKTPNSVGKRCFPLYSSKHISI